MSYWMHVFQDIFRFYQQCTKAPRANTRISVWPLDHIAVKFLKMFNKVLLHQVK